MVPRQYTRRSACANSLATVGSLQLPAPFDAEAFAIVLTERLNQRVQIAPKRLPATWACMWTGTAGKDIICYNADWPELAVALTGHAVGHLLLGHCGEARDGGQRDGGQFACIASAALPARNETIARLELREPVARLFSDREERQADDFGLALLERLGWPGDPLCIGCNPSDAMFGCVG